MREMTWSQEVTAYRINTTTGYYFLVTATTLEKARTQAWRILATDEAIESIEGPFLASSLACSL
jgi:hypothetical protein